MAAIAEAVLTLLTLAFLGLGGILLAYSLLRRERGDLLAFSIGAIIASSAEAILIGLVLGALGHLRFGLALSLQCLLVLGLIIPNREAIRSGELTRFLRLMLARAWVQLRTHWVLSLIALHAVGSEVLRGLLRPPLSWDSLMYHLLLAGTWVREGNLEPFFGPYPISFNGLHQANGSLWLWWWMAPSHSELYVNLAALPHLVLLGLATGGIARHLGARASWPIAAAVTVLIPTIIRFTATQYVDIATAGLLLGGGFFALRWAERSGWADALFCGLAFGIAVGTKALALPYGAAFGLAVLVTARRPWVPRLLHLAAAATALVGLGGYFWIRNSLHGVGLLFPQPNPFLPLPVSCNPSVDNPVLGEAIDKLTLWAQFEPLWESGQVTDTFLGTTWHRALELGIGPPALLLLVSVVALPFAVARERRGAALVVTSQVLLQLGIWLVVPVATTRYIFANVRFLDAAIGLGVAGLFVLLETRKVKPGWIQGLGVVLALQALLQLRSEMPRQVRIGAALVDLVVVLLIVAPRLRALIRSHPLVVSGLACALALGLVPMWSSFRHRDRYRAMSEELTAHSTPAGYLTPAWAWLDAHGGEGTVAVINSPVTHFMYPAMGPDLARRVVYVNITEEDHRNVAFHPNCNPRHPTVKLSATWWLANLRRQGVGWLLVSRYPGAKFPLEDGWARASTNEFVLVHEDKLSRIYRFVPLRAKTQ